MPEEIMRYKLFANLILVLLPSLGFGQVIITGHIINSEDKKPVKDAHVVIEGTSIQTTTDLSGYFQLSADSTKSLIVDCDGYEWAKIKVRSDSDFQIQLRKDVTPGFQGGIQEFHKSLMENLIYPFGARYDGIQGRVYVSFDVDSLNGLQNIKVIKDIGKLCAESVTYSLRELPNNWIPKARLVTLIIPVTFRLGQSGRIMASSTLQLGEPRTDIELPEGKLMSEIVVMTTLRN